MPRLTYLTLWDHGVVPVTQRRVLQTQLGLPVPLVEELLDAPGGPLVVHLPPLGRVTHVARVEEKAQYLGLVKAESIWKGVLHGRSRIPKFGDMKQLARDPV